MNPLVRMTGICKSFPGVQALSDARLELRPAEVHALLGENGAGKSTLMNILAGHLQPDAGTVELDGRPVAPATPRQARDLGVAMIHQELSLVRGLSVAENVCLGRECSRAGWIDPREIRRRARHALDQLGATLDPDRPGSSLSVAEAQLVEIARALEQDPRVLIMDEPTAALAGHEIQVLFTVIRGLCLRGLAVVYISHRMEEIFALAARATVMRDGRFVAERAIAQTSAGELIRIMVGRDLDALSPGTRNSLSPGTRNKYMSPPGAEILRVERLGLSGAVEPVTLRVRAGEVLGIAGLMGAGRTELARLIFGADRADTGHVEVDGVRLERHGPRQAAAAGLGFVPEDRKEQGLVLQRSVTENATLAHLAALSPLGLVDRRRERSIARALVDGMGIRTVGLEQRVEALSGGNQQKVLIARWLAARCKVLILDEPTRGIDVGAKSEVYRLIGDLVARGVAVILISSEMPELLRLSDRIAVMHEGRLAGVLSQRDATPEAIMALAVGRRPAPSAPSPAPPPPAPAPLSRPLDP